MSKLVMTGLVTLFLAVSFVVPASAQAPALVGQDKDWAVFSASVDGGNTCFVVSQPKNMEPKNVNRDAVYFFITQRPKDNVRNQVSVVTGYTYEGGSKTVVEIGSEKFTLFTKDNKAWIEDVQQQSNLIAAMKRGSTMIVRGRSNRGTNTTDTYSLSGITAAIARLAKACP